MRRVGQPIDHRNGRIAREIIDLSRLTRTDHDRVDIARKDPRSVADGLAAPELAVCGVEIDRVAAELAHRYLEGYARARRRLFENHREGLARQRPVAPAVLVRKADIEHSPQLGAVELVEVEKMPRWSGRRAPPVDRRQLADGASHAGHSRATLFMMSSASSISRSPAMSGGRMRSTFSPAVKVSRPFCRSLATKSPAGTAQRMPSSRPAPRSSANSLG